MDRSDRYARYALTTEMLETASIIRSFDPAGPARVAERIRTRGRLLLTGEGSSRIFPARHAVREALQNGSSIAIHTEGARQAAGYDLSQHAVFLASNSGRTTEVVALAQLLGEAGNPDRFALTANRDTVLESLCTETFILSCGTEAAVAATKSVVEQALFYDSLVRLLTGRPRIAPPALADAVDAALALPVDPAIVDAAASARTIYFAGYNDGVAEELTLKTNEITRRKSDYLEGTYAVHGIEEVMEPADLVVLVDPVPQEIAKFREVLVDGVGMTVVALADEETPFPTIRIPKCAEGAACVQLAAGWNLLVEIGLALGVDLDRPQRARKVGNETSLDRDPQID